MEISIRHLSSALVLALTGVEPAAAQYPSRPVRLIVPFAAGSGTDTVTRFVQPQLAAALGQPIVIDNRAGAGGNLGAELAAKAPADGYTVLVGNISHSTAMSLYSRLGYDLLRDFEPVTMLASGSFALAIHPSVPARSVKELVGIAKKRPGEINVATAGAAIQLAAKMFDSMARTKMTEVSYKSTPQAVTAVISGEASVSFPATVAVLPHHHAGKLRALAVTSGKRSAMAPAIPTIAESGLAGYEVTPWYGLLVPARTQKDIVARLQSATASALADAEVKKRFASTDFEPGSSTPEQLASFMRADIARWAKVVKESGMRAQ